MLSICIYNLGNQNKKLNLTPLMAKSGFSQKWPILSEMGESGGPLDPTSSLTLLMVFLSLLTDRLAVLENIQAIAPNHEARVTSIQVQKQSTNERMNGLKHIIILFLFIYCLLRIIPPY